MKLIAYLALITFGAALGGSAGFFAGRASAPPSKQPVIITLDGKMVGSDNNLTPKSADELGEALGKRLGEAFKRGLSRSSGLMNDFEIAQSEASEDAKVELQAWKKRLEGLTSFGICARIGALEGDRSKHEDVGALAEVTAKSFEKRIESFYLGKDPNRPTPEEFAMAALPVYRLIYGFAGDDAIMHTLQTIPKPSDNEFVVALFDLATHRVKATAVTSMPQTKANDADVHRWLRENSPALLRAQKEWKASEEEAQRKRDAYTLRPGSIAWDRTTKVFTPLSDTSYPKHRVGDYDVELLGAVRGRPMVRKGIFSKLTTADAEGIIWAFRVTLAAENKIDSRSWNRVGFSVSDSLGNHLPWIDEIADYGQSHANTLRTGQSYVYVGACECPTEAAESIKISADVSFSFGASEAKWWARIGVIPAMDLKK